MQVGLREHPDTEDAVWLWEDDGVFAKTHWSRLETVSIDTNWLHTIYSGLVAVPKAWGEKENAYIFYLVNESWCFSLRFQAGLINKLHILNSIFMFLRAAASIPEHLMHCIMVQSISIIHKAETFFPVDHSLINPELFGADIWIVGIICQKTKKSLRFKGKCCTGLHKKTCI